ncbi:MAG: SH3 domain-containing protein [Sulfurimonas sp.]|nr:SH3 domain-containing protein [Sulfurimonas sp.]
MKYILIILSVIILIGCSDKEIKFVESKPIEQKAIELEPVEKIPAKEILIEIDANLSCEEPVTLAPVKHLEIRDLVDIPQEVSYFSQNISTATPYYNIQQRYKKYYFSMWNIKRPQETLNSVKWPFASYCFGESFGENFQPLKKSFFDDMLESANFKTYATVNKRALTLKEINIRAFPTIKPLLKDPSIAGEGFPFDYLQNSTIAANKPIFISHYSKDREWAYAFSSFTSGWIKSDEFVIVDKKYTDKCQKAQQVRIVKEGVPIYSDSGKFLFRSKIGMMFALVSENKRIYTVLTVSSYKDSKPLFIKSKISKIVAHKEVLTLDRSNLSNIIREVSVTNYGWGGMYGQRDCSSMLRDLFAPFGIWLPRNSYQQSKVGKVISFDGMSDEEKIKLIKEKAIPFQTLLYKKGHIVLYVGIYNGEIVIFHNTWGIKTKKDGVEGRIIIGKPVFSSLKLGKKQKNYDVESEILRNLKSMNTLTQ